MKRLLFFGQFILLGSFSLFLVLTLLRFTGNKNPLTRFNYAKPAFNRVEEFDPALSHLNNLDKLEKYCDSIYNSSAANADKNDFEENYTNIVSSVIRKRFYHGYSYYGFDNNYVAMLFSRMTQSGYSAIVIPDDILKYPNAACSQQSIVMMEVLQAKNLKTRKVGFQGKKAGGHFCFEVFYNGTWHFYDPNMEPDGNVLSAYQRPGIAFLVNNKDVLLKAYNQYPQEEIMDIFPTYYYGAVNKFPAPRGIVFQKVTKLLSFSIWLPFLIAFIWVRRKYKRLNSNFTYVRNRRIYFPQSQRGTSPSYYPELTTPGT